MSATVFADTNILIYSRDEKSGDKRLRALMWLDRLAERNLLRINLQSINEYANWVLRRKPDHPIETLRQEIDFWRVFGDAPLQDLDVERAWIIRRRFGFQWFGCLLVASAVNLGCGAFLSEDMIDGARIEGLTIINPFTNDMERVLGLT